MAHPPLERVVHWHPAAPPKPSLGAPCNGCGLCCLDQPCPLGMVLSRRRHGSCIALLWQGRERRYVCGALTHPQAVWPRWLRPWSWALTPLVRRWIAAGQGCDAALQAVPVPPRRPLP